MPNLQLTDSAVTRIHDTRIKLAMIHGFGILALVAFFGALTLLVRFLAHVDLG